MNKRLFFKAIYHLATFLRGEYFSKEYNEYKANENLSLAQLEEIQLRKLNKLLQHAKNNSSYYRDKIPESVSSLSQLPKIPTIDKEVLRQQQDKLSASKSVFDRKKTSGGSTGAPVTLTKDRKGLAQEMAASWRGYSWANIYPGDSQARFWGVPRNRADNLRAKAIDLIANRKRYSAFGYNENILSDCAKSIEETRPDYFYGYTSIIEELCHHINNKKTSIQHTPKAIITTSEALSTPTRKYIEDTIGCSVFDEYGCGEVGTIAHECRSHRLHINMENVIVEVTSDDGNPLPTGSAGQLVITDLTNHATPLIRYKIMDSATISNEPCPCGLPFIVLDKVHGRAYDYLVNRSGKKYHGEFFLYILEDARKSGLSTSGIQIIQNRKDQITVKAIASETIQSKLAEFIEARIKNDFDRNITINFEWVSEIPREKSGKLRVVKNELL